MPRAMAAALAGLAILGVIAGIGADAVRLGPSSVDLPSDALGTSIERYPIADIDPAHDYYSVIITVANRFRRASIEPYYVDVRVSLTGADALLHAPAAGDLSQATTIEVQDIIPRTLYLATGAVTVREDAAFFEWTVRGERFLANQPIFLDYAQFQLSIRVAEGALPTSTAAVTLVWYYHLGIQAYPVASQTRDAECLGAYVTCSAPPSI